MRPNLKKLILCAVILILVAKRSGTAAVVTLLTGRRDVYARLRRNRFLVFSFFGTGVGMMMLSRMRRRAAATLRMAVRAHAALERIH